MSEFSGSEVWQELRWAGFKVLAGLLYFPETLGENPLSGSLGLLAVCSPFFGVVGLWLLALSQGLAFVPENCLFLLMLTVSS